MRSMLRGCAAFAALTFSFGAGAFAAEFSADMVNRAAGQTMEGRISVKDNKVRMEIGGSVIINRGDLGVTWVLMPGQGLYMEQPLDRSEMARTSAEVEGETERVPMGKEAVNGIVADKFKVTYNQQGQIDSMYQWLGPDGMLVKAAALDGKWSMEYRNIKTGVDDSLFEIPAGMRKMEIPAMPGMGSWQ